MKQAFFYADDSVVESTDLGWLQLEFGILTGLFDRVGLQTNIQKTMGVVFNIFWASGCGETRPTPGG